jgi:hypothetical protein
VYNLSEKKPIYLENTSLGLRMDLALDSSNKEISEIDVSNDELTL